MDASKEIKSMKLYNHIDRVNKELKELGYKDGDPLKVEDVCKFDQMHYYGTQAIDEAVKALGIRTHLDALSRYTTIRKNGEVNSGGFRGSANIYHSSPTLSSSHHILDVGSGLGGPARHLAHSTNCLVTALELQEDLHKEAENLTQRCNLQDRLKHITGDFLQMDLGANKFDFLVSWLVFLHIENKKRLFEHCFHTLKPGGRIFIEDFYQQSGVSLTEEDKRSYKRDLYMTNLPEKNLYINQLKDAGFTDIQFEDHTEAYLAFVSKRQLEFSQQKDRHVRVIGQDAYESLQYFYSAVKKVFSEGLTGGCRVIATKPAV